MSAREHAAYPPAAELAHESSLVEVMSRFGLEAEDMCIVGDGVLAAHGIRPNHGIDICLEPGVRDRVLSRVEKRSGKGRLRESRTLAPHVTLRIGEYAAFGVSDDVLLSDPSLHEWRGGRKCARLELVMVRKIEVHRKQDLQDVLRIERYAHECGPLDWKRVLSFMRWRRSERGPQQRSVRRSARSTARRFVTAVRHVWSVGPIGRSLSSWRWIPEGLAEDIDLCMPAASLLARQRENGSSARLDLFLRILAAQNVFDGNGPGLDLYEKLAHGGVGGPDALARFRECAQSVRARGLDRADPVVIDSRGRLVEGADRLAAALSLGIENIPVRVARGGAPADFSLRRLTQSGFTDSEIGTILTARDEVSERFGMYFPALLWPPAKHLFDDIEADLGKECRIVRAGSLAFELPDFTRFVRAIYAIDDVYTWKMEVKFQAMLAMTDCLEMRIVLLDVPTPEFWRKGSRGVPRSRTVEGLKQRVRTKYAPRVEDYFHDVIVHIGDNHSHNVRILAELAACGAVSTR